MKTLPNNISAHPDGLLVRVLRSGVLFQAFVAASNTDALGRAVKLRDRFLKLAGGVHHPKSHRPHRWAHSNTGVVGVSETVKFVSRRAYQGFNVSWSEQGKGHCRRFNYGGNLDRTTALRNAIAFRNQKTGQPVEVYHG